MGYRLCQSYGRDHEVFGMGHKELDITSREAVEECLEQIRPDIVVHCAAISDLKKCEEYPEESQAVNVTGTVHIARSCRRVGAKLIFCSSDQVYSGYYPPIEESHQETEELSPSNLYGRQKLEAERRAMEENPNTVCLRLSWLYAMPYREGEEHSNLMKQLVDKIRAGEQISYPVNDYRGITDVRDAVENMSGVYELEPGVYNYGSCNALSTYELVKWLLDPIPWAAKLLTKNETAFARQPRNLRMSPQKLNEAGVFFPSARGRIEEYTERVQNVTELYVFMKKHFDRPGSFG